MTPREILYNAENEDDDVIGVILRDGNIMFKIKDKLMDEFSWIRLGNYNEDLECELIRDSQFDIMEIFLMNIFGLIGLQNIEEDCVRTIWIRE